MQTKKTELTSLHMALAMVGAMCLQRPWGWLKKTSGQQLERMSPRQ